LALILTGANRNDVTQLLPLVEAIPPIRGKRGRPLSKPRIVLGDRGYDHDKYRKPLHAAGIATEIARRGEPHRKWSWQNPLGRRTHDCLATQLQEIARALRAPRHHPRSLPENRLLHHLLASSQEVILLGLLSANGVNSDIEIDTAMQQVVPRLGAAALATFKTSTGRRVQFELFRPDGKPMPFGATVDHDDGQRLSIADPRGRVLALLSEEQVSGELLIRWDTQQCRVRYALPEKKAGENYQNISLKCNDVTPAPDKPAPAPNKGRGTAAVVASS